MIGMGLAEAGYLPDWMIRRGIRWMLRDRLRGLEFPEFFSGLRTVCHGYKPYFNSS